MQQKLKPFKKKKKKKLNLKLCRKKSLTVESARYIGVIRAENLDWKYYVNHISHKLIRGNAILSKLRN